MGSGRPLLILHGLFGSLDNWKTLGNQFAEDYEVYLIDQRNHGKSPHSEDFDYQVMADDLIEFVNDHYLRGIYILGHSMGGKTVMNFAQHCDLIDKIVIADIAPRAYKPHHNDLVRTMESIDLSLVDSRSDVDELLKKDIPNFSVRQFLLKNLYWRKKDQLDWKINLPVIKKNMDIIAGSIENHVVTTPTLFIQGELSPYIMDTDYPMIKKQFPNSRIVKMEQVGHWLHAENPELFYQIVSDFLKEE
jgi:pimeloyl-ACP methyl ester carboxylesterase